MKNSETKLLNLHRQIKKYSYYFLIFFLLVSLQIFILPSDIVENFPVLNDFINFMKSYFEFVNYSYENLPTFVTFYVCEMSLLGLIYGICCFIYAVYFIGFHYDFWLKRTRENSPGIFFHENKSAPDQFIALILRPREFLGLLIKNRFLFFISTFFFLLMFYDIVKTKHKEGYLSPVVQLRHSDFFIIGIFDCFGFIWLSIAMLGVILGIVISLIMDFE